MMGTLAGVLARKGIRTPDERYWADVEGDIENVNDILKITQIRVKYHLKVPQGKRGEAEEALSSYLSRCPAAQSVIGCIQISDEATIEEVDE
ncbi:MAG: OsmC family protein [Desulfobacteraceae bacterium]|jgi:organic hydroperoxide reductase OsmC/OhrA